VFLETNNKGYQLFHDDPRVSLTHYDINAVPVEQQLPIAQERWAKLEEELEPDRVINLWQTLETECIAERHQDAFFLPVTERREIFGNKNFYEAVGERCGMDVPDDLTGLYFTERQITWAKKWRASISMPVVLVVLAGSCAQKVYPRSPELMMELAQKAKVYILGDDSTAGLEFEHPNIKNLSGVIPIKQAILMTKYADFVFGGETGLLVAAGMWGTPKTMLCTSASVYQACKYHENDYSLQADIPCSPCHRAIYTQADCESLDCEGEDCYPACTSAFDYDTIRGAIEEYALH
jgi:hypothetical protein